MKALKINYFDSADEILRKARKRYGEHKKFAFVEWPDGFPYGSIRLVVMSKEEWDEINES